MQYFVFSIFIFFKIIIQEFPEAKRLLLQKGREILLKDNLIDESIQEEDIGNEQPFISVTIFLPIIAQGNYFWSTIL